MSDWQLIDTAPRDGTVFLGFFEQMMPKYIKTGQGVPWCVAWFSTSVITGEVRIMIYGIGEFAPEKLCPTHWAPLTIPVGHNGPG